MAQLTGKNIRTEIKSLEIVSDDGKRVISIEQTNDGNVKLTERDANAEPWAWDGVTNYTLKAEQRSLVVTAINRADASYYDAQLKEITTTRFQIPQPEPEKVEEENCSPIAIADAQAAAALTVKEARIEAVKFELRLDHTRDRHASADVEGCPLCESKHITPALGFNDGYIPALSDDAADDLADARDMPF